MITIITTITYNGYDLIHKLIVTTISHNALLNTWTNPQMQFNSSPTNLVYH